MRKPLFSKNYAASNPELKLSRDELRGTASKLQWPAALTNGLLLCHSELMANSINHSQGASLVNLKLVQTASEIIFEYCDNGAPFNPFAKAASPLDAIAFAAENGRGVALISHYADSVRYAKASSPFNNRIECHFALAIEAHRACVLIVEDDPVQNMLFSEYLCTDYNVLPATSAEQAHHLLNEHTVDLVISDISMPGTNGIDLRKQLLQDSRTDLIPFMFLTGSEDSESAQKLAHLGIDDFLQKPVDKARLLASVKRVLSRFDHLVNRLGEQLDARITQALCPPLPSTVDGWQLSVDRRDTGRGGGDVVFAEQTPAPTLVLLDVVGHDISAKFFAHAHTAYLRSLVRSLASHSSGQPFAANQVLTQFSNAAFSDELLSHTLLTTLIVELLPEGRLRYAAAGHPPPLIVGPAGVKTLAAGGSLPGLLADAPYQNIDIQLEPGDRFLMYSDGLFEGTDTMAQRKLLEQGVMAAIVQSAKLPLEQARQQIMHCFDQLAGEAKDDVTLVLLEPMM